jgi:hypothetical protein
MFSLWGAKERLEKYNYIIWVNYKIDIFINYIMNYVYV